MPCRVISQACAEQIRSCVTVDSRTNCHRYIIMTIRVVIIKKRQYENHYIFNKIFSISQHSHSYFFFQPSAFSSFFAKYLYQHVLNHDYGHRTTDSLPESVCSSLSIFLYNIAKIYWH